MRLRSIPCRCTHPRAAAASGPANAFAASLAPLPAPLVFYDVGRARGANAADIPLSGLSDAPDGHAVEVQLFRVDTGAAVTPWVTIATVAAGAWLGVLPGVPNQWPRLRRRSRCVKA